MPNPSENTPSVNTEPVRRLRSKLSLADFEVSSSHYPEGARAPAAWLFQFKHERCNGSHDLVAEILKKINPDEYPDKSQYIYQVTTGRYFRTGAVGKAACAALQEMVDRLKQWDLLDQQRGRVPFNEELRCWQMVRDYIDRKRARAAVCKFGAIEGDTGTGKTECTKHYKFLNNHLQTVRIETPSKATLARFLVKLGACYNISRSLDGNQRLIELDENINETRTIIVENVQKLFNPKTGNTYLPIFSYLQELQDDTGCTVILTWTPVFREDVLNGRERKYFDQFVSRIGGVEDVLTMPRLNKADLLSIAEQFEIRDVQKCMPMLAEWSRQPGALRLIYERLQKAKTLAGKKAVDHSTLEAVATTPVSQVEEDEEGGAS